MPLPSAAPGAGADQSSVAAHRRLHPIAPASLLLCLLIARPGTAEERCFSCHAAPGLAERIADGRRTSAAREELLFKGEAHTALACTTCHPQAGTSPHPERMTVVTCESCHDGIPPHVIDDGRQDADTNARRLPACVDCHGYHGVRGAVDPGSRVHRTRVAELCLSCHRRLAGDPLAYLSSAHGRSGPEGAGEAAAVCTDCHLPHLALEGETALTGVTRSEVAATCGECHEEVLKEYEGSVHGRAHAQGNADAPVCTSCHEEHRILPPADPGSSVNPLRIPETCGTCHGEVPLATKHDLDPDVYKTYRDSYHGTANQYGSLTVAYCASCHAAHNILPSSDPRSTVHPANLQTTCGECHEGISEKVARGEVHVRISRSRSAALFWVAFGFKWLTIGTMVALIGHIILDFLKKLRLRWAARREASASGEQGE